MEDSKAQSALGSEGSSGAPASSCRTGVEVAALEACMNAGTAPKACLAQVLSGPGAPLCDRDEDGLSDDFEEALARAYSMAFAFNQGDGSKTKGSTESAYPSNLTEFVASSELVYRSEDRFLRAPKAVMDASPTLESLAQGAYSVEGALRRTDDPQWGAGANFWLCRKPEAKTPAEASTSVRGSAGLPHGIDVASVVRPLGGKEGRYGFVGQMLFYADNRFTFDDHEGDWEGTGVFIDFETGRVVGAYFDRHATVDKVNLMELTGDKAVPELDGRTSKSPGNLCSPESTAAMHGVRFWDYDGPRHHAMAYVAAGSHATYSYPGNTKIGGVFGCEERLIVRDTHNGEGHVFLPWRGGYTDPGGREVTVSVDSGVHFRNAGEPNRPLEAYARYRGQWGCQDARFGEGVGRSYPGPWGNHRHCRKWLAQDWGSAPPFRVPDASSGCP